jgi:hypothetical protein
MVIFLLFPPRSFVHFPPSSFPTVSPFHNPSQFFSSRSRLLCFGFLHAELTPRPSPLPALRELDETAVSKPENHNKQNTSRTYFLAFADSDSESLSLRCCTSTDFCGRRGWMACGWQLITRSNFPPSSIFFQRGARVSHMCSERLLLRVGQEDCIEGGTRQL